MESNEFTGEYARNVIKGLGGEENITSIDSCITRLRLILKNTSLIDERLLIEKTNAKKILIKGNNVHVVYGIKIDYIRKAIEEEISHDADLTPKKILEAIGGKKNIFSIDSCISRLRLVLKDEKLLNEDILIKDTGAVKVLKSGNDVQIVYGVKVGQIRDAVELEMKKINI